MHSLIQSLFIVHIKWIRATILILDFYIGLTAKCSIKWVGGEVRNTHKIFNIII